MTCVVPREIHPLDLAAPAVQVADHVPHERLGHRDLDPHQRLEDHRMRLVDRIPDRQGRSKLEGHLRRVDLVV